MNKTLLKKQIPTLFGLIILFIGAGVGVLLVGDEVNFLPRAAPEHAPKRLQVTNVTDSSFTVSWVTDAATVGFIRYGTSADTETTIADDRDQLSGDTGDFRVHHVTVRGLNASSQYYFEVGSGPSAELYDDNGAPYQVTTGPTLTSPAEPESIFGKVVTQAQSPAENAVVFIKMDGASPLSTLVKASSSWAASLSTIRTTDLTQYLPYDPDTSEIQIEVIGSDGVPTSGVTNTSNDQPVPTITLGEDFNFTGSAVSIDEPSEEDDTPRESGFEIAAEDASSSAITTVSLLSPTSEGEELNTTKPEFQGKAPANIPISITVESEPTYQDEVVSGPDGYFSWSPPADLEPGEHTITLSWIDPDSGVQQFLTRNFVVLAQGESTVPAFESTPSATTEPTPTPTATPVVVASPSPSPTSIPSPSPSPSPTATPDTRVSQPSTESGVPVAGGTTETILMLLIGSGLVGSGFYFSRKFE